MAISVNTNIASLTAQKSLAAGTAKMNTAMERLTTGLKINSSKDDAAGMAVSTKLNYKLSSFTSAKSNGQMGSSMLDTQEGVCSTIQGNLQRIRDLTEQAANGTYGADSMKAITSEVFARLAEISRVANTTEFNGQYLMDGSINHDINLQVGIQNDENSIIALTKNLFTSATATALIASVPLKYTDAEGNVHEYTDYQDIVNNAYTDDMSARAFLNNIDSAIANITERITTIGGVQQRISSAIDSITVMSTTMTSSVSAIQDADVAEESASFVQQQILQQISTAMLSTANQSTTIALSLIRG